MPATRPVLFVFMGLIASGKSSLAQALAKNYGLAAYNSDVVRKELAGLNKTDKAGTSFDGGIYTPEFSRRTYDELLQRAAADLAQGRSVILDASYHKAAERRKVLEFCQSQPMEYLFILCRASEEETRRRLALRARDPKAVSDGTLAIYQKQQELFEYPDEVAADHLIDLLTDRPINELLTAVTSSRKFPSFSA